MGLQDLRIGVSLYAFTGTLFGGSASAARRLILKALDEARKLNVEHIEIPLDAEARLPGTYNEEVLSALRSMRNEGVTISAHMPFFDVDLGSLVPEIREASVKTCIRAAKAVEGVDIDYYVFHAVGGAVENISAEESLDEERRSILASVMANARKSAEELVEALGREKLVIENTPEVSFEAVYAVIVEPLDIGVCLDAGHALLAGRDPARLAVSCASRLRLVHVHDVVTIAHRRVRMSDDHRRLGSGSLDLRALVDALDFIGYNGPIIVEVINPSDLKESIDLLRRVLEA